MNFIDDNVFDVMDKDIDNFVYQNEIFCNNHFSGERERERDR